MTERIITKKLSFMIDRGVYCLHSKQRFCGSSSSKC